MKHLITEIKTFIKIQKCLLNKNFVVIYPPQGMGDILMIAALLDSYKKKFNKKVCVIVTKKYFVNLLEIFSETVNKIIFSKKKYKFINNNKNILDIEKIINTDKFINMKYNIAKALDFDENTPLYLPKKIDFNEIELPFNPVNGIIISPYAISCPKCIPDEFWIKLADILITKGYNVYFNVDDKDYFAQKYNNCFFDIKTTIAFANKCKYFIGYRSGLCDVISYFSNTKKIFIYPDKPHEINNINYSDNLSYAEIYLKSCSMKTLWDKNEDIEIIYNNKTLDIVLDIIINKAIS